ERSERPAGVEQAREPGDLPRTRPQWREHQGARPAPLYHERRERPVPYTTRKLDHRGLGVGYRAGELLDRGHLGDRAGRWTQLALADAPNLRCVGLEHPVEQLAGPAPLRQLEGGAEAPARGERADHADHALLLVVEQRRSREMRGLTGLERERP